MSYSKRQIEEYNTTYNQFAEDSAVFAALMWSEASNILDEIHRANTSLHTINERQCCEEMSEATATRLEKREEKIKERITKLAERLGFGVYFNGDPRGGAVRFILPSGRSNNWDGESWGVYW